MLLRSRQTEFVARAVTALRERGNTLAVAPTGFGKTIAMAAIIGRLLAGGGRALVLQHRHELISQNVAKFQAMNPTLPVSIVDANAKDFSGRAVFAMVPTLARSRVLGLLPAVDLIVIDEAHHATAKSYRRILDRARELNPEAMILGLTATPRRGDKKALRDIFDNLADQVTLGELIQSGHLVRPKTYVVDLGFQEAILAVKRRAADFDPEEIDAILNHEPVNAAVVEHWREKARSRQTVAFTSTVAHAQNLAGAFRVEGIRAQAVHGDMPAAQRREVLAAYDRGDLQVLTNCFVLGEGWDNQPTSCILLLRPTSFRSTWVQMIGRGLRPVDPQIYPGVVKTDCLILDFGAATLLHGSLEEQVDLDAKAAALVRRAGGDEKLPKECPACGADVPRAAVECPLCGEPFADEITRLMNFELVEIDMFDSSNFAWTDVSPEQDGSALMAKGFDSWAIVRRYDAGWAAVGGLQLKEREDAAKIIAFGDRSVCLARADDFVNEHETSATAHRGRAWTRQPPTARQLDYLPRWARSRDWTRYEASCHLTTKFNAKVIDRALALPEREVA